jgi:hypothetical protein
MKNNTIRGVETTTGSQINFHSSKEEKKEFDFDLIFYQNIKNAGINLY